LPFDFDAKAVARAEKSGASGASTLKDLVKQLTPPRTVWIMVPAGEATQSTVDELAKLLSPDDAIVDGGNSRWTDDKLRSAALRKKKIHYIDVGTSGGVWGLANGYCMMVGGPTKAVRRLAPILDVLAPPTSEDSLHSIGKYGWHHFGPSGAGHYVKMVHNAVEYGLMQALRRGFELFHASEYELDNAKIAHLWNQASVVRSWLCELRARAFDATATTFRSWRAGSTTRAKDAGRSRTRSTRTCRRRRSARRFSAASTRARTADYARACSQALRNQFGGHAVKKAGT